MCEFDNASNDLPVTPESIPGPEKAGIGPPGAP